jgi:hypothetical protein
MTVRTHTWFRHDHGQALVEFALALPLLLILILGALDFGNAYNYKNDETSLANDAARYGVVAYCGPCGSQTIEQYIKSTAPNSLQNGGPGIGVRTPGMSVSFCLPNSGTWGIGNPLEANVTATYAYLPYLIAKIGIPTTVTISSSAIEAIETSTYSASLFGGTIPAC